MRNFQALTTALDLIEENLTQPVSRQEIARHCYISLSALEKLFRYALHCSLNEYISKRRITQSAKDLLESDETVTDIAFKYQYQSPEVFNRAFRRVWQTSPTRFRETWTFSGLFPKRKFDYSEGDDLIMSGKKVDLSEAYDFLSQRRGTYVICFDISGLMPINEISRKAGDLAILETAARIDHAATDNMLALRIGGDEFALLTGLSDASTAQAIADKVLAENGKPFSCDGRAIPLTLWAALTTIPEQVLRFDDLFTRMQRVIDQSKR